MKIAIVYHFPFDLGDQYAASSKRFDDTYNRFKPQIEHEVFLSAGYGLKTSPDPIDGIGWKMVNAYQGEGCDIGAYLSVAPVMGHDFAVFCSATTYFHRPGWLERLIEAREQHGEGLYAISASFEGSPLGTHPAPNPHIRTSCFACNPKDLATYPHKINSREDCYRFENGEWRITRHIQNPKIVYWDTVCDLRSCRNPANVFRRGDQSNLLVWDRRTDEYAKAITQEKLRLERLADGDIAHFPI